MISLLLAAASLLLAFLSTWCYWANLREYRLAPVSEESPEPPSVSVLIPARNEEDAIGSAVKSALSCRGVHVEVVVLDDHSKDRTAEIVKDLAKQDSRVRLVTGPPLPEGWCGKQHACHILAEEARYPLMAFLDADVRLQSDGLARLVAFLNSSGSDLVSGLPEQQTETFLEKLLIPLIHFILLGFLPVGRMRQSKHPAYAAGCGQLFLTKRSAYQQAGGHAAIRASLHDGITLPRAYRQQGLLTDLCDATDLARCRMYQSSWAVWKGLAKNAAEGLGSPKLIVPATLVLFVGQILPFVMLANARRLPISAIILSTLAAVTVYVPPIAGRHRFRQSWLSALLHPVGMFLLILIQWDACLRLVFGRPYDWKGRRQTIRHLEHPTTKG